MFRVLWSVLYIITVSVVHRYRLISLFIFIQMFRYPARYTRCFPLLLHSPKRPMKTNLRHLLQIQPQRGVLENNVKHHTLMHLHNRNMMADYQILA
jgi:hypothetical protein